MECFAGCNKPETTLTEAEVNQITDGIKFCLQSEAGRREFQQFLEDFRLEEHHRAAILFYAKCSVVLDEASKLSPRSRTNTFSKGLKKDLDTLCDMAEGVNFDSSDVEVLACALEGSDEEKLKAIAKSQDIAMKLLEGVYERFRAKMLQSYKLSKS